MIRGMIIAGLLSGMIFGGSKRSPRAASDQTAFVVTLRGAEDAPAVREALAARGLTALEHKNLLPWDLVVTGDGEAVLGLEELDEVVQIYPASYDLLAGADVIGCAGPLMDGSGVLGQYVTMSPGWPRTAVETTIGYYFGAMTGRLPAGAVQNEILRAFGEWAKYAPIRFTAAPSATSKQTIHLMFTTGPHGDGYPFDGQGKVLAHTFYPAPPNEEPLAGDMHLDADENWGIGNGTDVYTVVLHELGHALGFGHSDAAGSVMYPYYRFGYSLSSDDIKGLQALYGSNAPPTPVPVPTPTPTPAPTPVTPSLTVQIPASPTALDRVRITGTSQNASAITWRSDRGASGTATGTANWWAAVALLEGVNNVTVMAGTVSKTVSVTRQTPVATKDTTTPTVKITFPSSSIYSTNAATLTVRGTASDSGGVKVVTWSTSTAMGDADGTSDWSAAIPLSKGSTTLTVRAYDASGNSSWRAVTLVRQ